MESSMPICQSHLLSALDNCIQSSATGWVTSDELLIRLGGVGGSGLTKKRLNEALYALLYDEQVQKTDTIPPSWRRSVSISNKRRSTEGGGGQQEEENPRQEPLVHVVVDLGNVHCCLPKLIPYARAGLLTVAAYADMAYRGYGIIPPLREPNISVFQATTPDKNSADVEIVWRLSRMSGATARGALTVFVCTKDLGFQRIKSLVEEDGHNLTFVMGWSQLKLHIE